MSHCLPPISPPSSSSSSVYLSLKEEDGDGKEMESGPDEVLMAENYMTMAQSENCRLVDASIQKNISFDGKPLTPTGWSGGMAEVFSLREQLKQAEEKASQVQREVSTTVSPASHLVFCSYDIRLLLHFYFTFQVRSSSFSTFLML